MDNALTLDKNLVNAVRKELQLPFFELIAYMAALDWDFSIEMPAEHKGSVSFNKMKNWHDRPIVLAGMNGCCCFGYRFDTTEEQEITIAAQRSAELCLQIYELFVNKIPSNPYTDGVIREDFIANKPEHSKETYQEMSDRHKEFHLTFYPDAPWSDNAIYFTYYKHVVTVAEHDYAALLHDIDHIKLKLNGTYAIEA